MNLSKFTIAIYLSITCFLFSCGSTPEGKFKDDKTASNGSIDTTKHFLHIASATKWENDWSKENIVVYHWRGEPDNLHPTNGKSNPRRVILDYTHRFLINIDFEKLTLRPDLIKTMPLESSNGLDYTYELLDEPTWDDGAPLTVDDVLFSLMAQKCPMTNNGFAKPYFETLGSITVDGVNPRKFVLHMTRKYIQNVAFLGDVPIISKKYFDPKNVLGKYTLEQFGNPDFTKTPHPDLDAWAKEFNDAKYGRDLKYLNGLGAYKVTAWEDKQRVELTKKTNHWTSKLKNPDMYDSPQPEKIIFKINVDDNSVALEFKKQTIDVSTWLSTHGLADLQKDADFNKNYHSSFVQNFNYQYIGMNMKPESSNRSPFFVDKQVRKAMALLVAVDQFNKSYIEGQAVRMVSLVSPVKTKVINKDLIPVPFDIDSAKTLLDLAGWKDTDGDNVRDKMIDGKKVKFEFEMLIMSGNVVTENIAKDIQTAMYKAGVKTNIRTLEFVTFYEQVQLHNFDMYFGAWAGSVVPDDYKQIWRSSSWTDGSNYVGFGNSQTDALIDSTRTETNDSLRIPMEKRLQKLVYDEQPYIFLYMVPTKIAIHKRFDHVDMYFEKPGVYLGYLQLMSPGNMGKNAATN